MLEGLVSGVVRQFYFPDGCYNFVVHHLFSGPRDYIVWWKGVVNVGSGPRFGDFVQYIVVIVVSGWTLRYQAANGINMVITLPAC